MEYSRIKFFAFADDLTVAASSWIVLEQAFDLLQHFRQATDLVLNLKKSHL